MLTLYEALDPIIMLTNLTAGAGTHRREDLGLGHDAVRKAVLPIHHRHVRPRHLEACDWLMRLRAGDTPEEVSGEVFSVSGEGRRQVLGFGRLFHTYCKENQVSDHVVSSFTQNAGGTGFSPSSPGHTRDLWLLLRTEGQDGVVKETVPISECFLALSV